VPVTAERCRGFVHAFIWGAAAARNSAPSDARYGEPGNAVTAATTRVGAGASSLGGALALDLTEQDARRLLASASVARLATVTDAGRPHIVPVVFAADEDHIYTAVDGKPKKTRNLARLRNIRGNPQVAVLADGYDSDWTALWWVRADGRAAILEDPRLMAGPIALLTRRYPQYLDIRPAGPVIVISVERWTGWAASPAG
jgi:PPOX class probable F420-dependent enzyme